MEQWSSCCFWRHTLQLLWQSCNSLSVKRNPPPYFFFFHCLLRFLNGLFSLCSVFCVLLLLGTRWGHPKGAGWDAATEEHQPHTVAGAAREYCHLHCTPSLPQGRSDPVFEEVPIVQMTDVIICFGVFVSRLDPETTCHLSPSVLLSMATCPSLNIMTISWGSNKCSY